jgi:hypothetical protein
MTQKQQVIDTMKENGGYATFQQLNHLMDFSSWKTKTPQASVRQIVQVNDEFFRIKPGLWALVECKGEVLRKFDIQENNKESDDAFTHSYYIGINANSDNKEKAADFINFMLSRDMQNTLAGIPINGDSLNDRINNFIMETDRSAAEAYIQEYALRSDGELDNIESEIGSQVTSSQSGNGDELSDMDNNLPEGIEIILDSDKLETIAQTYREIVFEANEYDSNDRQIINMLIEEAEGYLNGSVDGESTVDVISSKVNLYLSELEP